MSKKKPIPHIAHTAHIHTINSNRPIGCVIPSFIIWLELNGFVYALYCFLCFLFLVNIFTIIILFSCVHETQGIVLHCLNCFSREKKTNRTIRDLIKDLLNFIKKFFFILLVVFVFVWASKIKGYITNLTVFHILYSHLKR